MAELAAELGIEALKPERPREPSFQERLRAIAPDCCPVVAYGALLPQSALDIPVHGWVNLHFSVLPAWRGAAPVQHAVLRGDDITGASTFQIVKELDAGPVYGTLTEPVRPTDTSGDLLDRLAVGGARSCWSRPWTGSRTAPCWPYRSRPTASASPPSSPLRTPGSTGSCPPT